MLNNFSDAASFSAFMRDLWSLIPPVLQLLITAVLALFLVYGFLKLID